MTGFVFKYSGNICEKYGFVFGRKERSIVFTSKDYLVKDLGIR